MTPTPVGMRCPECSRQKTKVRTAASIRRDPQLTYVLIAINVIAFLAMSAGGGGFDGRGGTVYGNGALFGPLVADGEYWRLITGGFLHSPNPIHVLFNMYALYWLGTMLEPVLGNLRFVAVYFASLFAGSMGALIDAAARQETVGASGAVFGLMAAAFVFQRARGVDPMRSGLGPVILINLALPFIAPGLNISIGGHVGGLIGGGLAALAIERVSPLRRGDLLPVLVCVAIGAVSVAGAIIVADDKAAPLLAMVS
jgi:membrane associated rhomboid family serine protease